MSSAMLMSLTYISMTIALALAQLPVPLPKLPLPLPQLIPSPLLPPLIPLLPPLSPEPNVTECWCTFSNISGCASEIIASFLHGHIGSIGPACCKAITEVNEKCWPKMFPSMSNFVPVIKGYCAKQNEDAPPPSPIVNAIATNKVEYQPTTPLKIARRVLAA